MSDQHELDRAVRKGHQTDEPSAALAQRVQHVVAEALDAKQAEDPPPRRRLKLVLALAVCLLVILVPAWRSRCERILVPALQLTGIAEAAVHAPVVHQVVWRVLADGREEKESELWIQPPWYKVVQFNNGEATSHGYDGESQWSRLPDQDQVITQPNAAPGVPQELLLGSTLERALQDRARTVTVTEGHGRDGRREQLVTVTRPDLRERVVVHADPDTQLPLAVEVFGAEPGARVADRLVSRSEFDYPPPKPPEFYRPDLTPDSKVVELEADASDGPVAKDDVALADRIVTTLEAAGGHRVPILDVAQNEEGLVFVAFSVPSRELLVTNLDVFGDAGAGLLWLDGFMPQPARHEGAGYAALFGGAALCPADPEAPLFRPVKVTALLSQGSQGSRATADLEPGQVRRIDGTPAWWRAYMGPVDLAAGALAVQADYWLGRDPARTERLARKLLALNQTEVLASDQIEHWQLLGEALRAQGKHAEARTAYSTALKMVPELSPRARERWQKDLEKSLAELPAAPAP